MILPTGFGQSGYQKAQIPNYILADNAPFIVAIITQFKFTETSRNGISLTSGNGITRKKVEDFDLSKVTNHDEKFLLQLYKSCTEEFEKIGMSPAGFISEGQAQLMLDTDKWMNSLETQFSDDQPQFMFTIIVPADLAKAKKAIAKGKFTLDLVKPVSITLSKFSTDRKNPPKAYSLVKMNMSIADGFKYIKKDIDSKSEGYFLKSLPADQIVNFNEIMEESQSSLDMFKGGEDLNSLPKDLLESTLVVYDTQKERFIKKNKDISNTVIYKAMTKNYPGKFITMGPSEYADYINKPAYKYIMLTQVSEMKKITKSSVNDRGISKKTTTIVPLFYYYIKDINSKENYYSELGKSNMEEHSKSHIPPALKYFFKVLKDNYKW
ncbi:MAG: hypothetical protein COB15_06385 [Flavobacteriales bacterium]|nr:MAG: hypothetical protein COB15_06385 [Flavobacteriales bacterium]